MLLAMFVYLLFNSDMRVFILRFLSRSCCLMESCLNDVSTAGAAKFCLKVAGLLNVEISRSCRLLSELA